MPLDIDLLEAVIRARKLELSINLLVKCIKTVMD